MGIVVSSAKHEQLVAEKTEALNQAKATAERKREELAAHKAKTSEEEAALEEEEALSHSPQHTASDTDSKWCVSTLRSEELRTCCTASHPNAAWIALSSRITTVATETKFAGKCAAETRGSANTGARVSFSVCSNTEVSSDGKPAGAVARSATIDEPWPSSR